MPKTVTIEVEEGITGHRGVSHKIVLREPTYDDFMDLGDAVSPVPAGNGLVYMMPNHDKIRAYAERLMIEPTDQLSILNLPMKYAREVTDAVANFFRLSDATSQSKTSNPGFTTCD